MTDHLYPAWTKLRGAIFTALALLLAGCTSGGEFKPISLPAAPAQDQLQSESEREHQRILAAYGGAYEDPRLHALITTTVDRLVAASERPQLKFRMTLLNSPTINAFALPNGRLYVSRGLIALANDNAEVASVLAHEMAHVIAEHAALRADKARQAAIVSVVVGEVLSDPQLGRLALAKSKLALASFSRAQEFEADGIGVGIATRAGYDPFGAARFLNAMQRNAELKPTADKLETSFEFLSTHPATPQRIKNALTNARQFTGPGSGERNRNEYLASLEGLVYGEDPSEGFVRGRRFLHPKLGFTFQAPPGFVLDNTAQAVLGIKDGGEEAMRLDVVRIPAEQSLTDYLRSGWIENVNPGSVETLTVSGFPVATATASGRQWSFRLFAVRFGTDVYRFIYAAKQMTVSIDRSFRESIATFRRMSLKEIKDAKPLRIKVVTVRPGDTVARLARRMAVDHQRLQRFRVLNGLEPGDRVKPGDLVKIVVE